MGTNEPGGTGDDGTGSAGDPYGTPYSSGPSYSGYREGMHGEPVPDSAWQDPAGGTTPDPTARYASPPPPQYPAQYPYPQYPGDPTAQEPYPQPYGAPYPPYGGPYPPPGPYPYAPPRPTNGMAVASLVLGILWLYWIGSILALIFGYVARQQIRERGEGGDGMAVAGIVLGWIGVGVMAVFVVIFVLAGLSSGFQ